MKKNYIAPELEVTIVDAQAIIATSDAIGGGESNAGEGKPIIAESKLYDYDDYFDIDW